MDIVNSRDGNDLHMMRCCLAGYKNALLLLYCFTMYVC